MQRLNSWLAALASGALLATGASALTTDTDSDTITDDLDNCILVAQGGEGQPGTCDTDADTDTSGAGNACDADFDNNGFVNFADLQIFGQNFGATGDNVADLDCNQFVNFADLQRFGQLFGTNPGPSATNCGIPDDLMIDDTAEWADFVDNPGVTENSKMYLRGTHALGFGIAEDGYNDFKRLVSDTDTTLVAEFAVAAASHKWKMLDDDNSVNRGTFGTTLVVDTPTVMQDDTQTCTNSDAPVSVPADGCYSFTLDGSDVDNLQLTMNAVTTEGICTQPPSIGGDELSNGERVYIRGGLINNWAAIQGSNDFVNTGAGPNLRETQFELLLGEYNYKVANADWSYEASTCGDADPPPQVLSPGETVTLTDLTLNSNVIFPVDGCYRFELDISGGTDNPTITMERVTP